MGIYDRDWYRNGQKSPNDNKRVSREGAERIKRMMEGASLNEPPKVDPKYRFEFAGSPTGDDRQSSNGGYDPTYGCGYQSTTVKQGRRYKKPSFRIKPLPFIILTAFIGYLAAVGYNVVTINKNLNNEFLGRNGLSISMEVGSRIGLVGSLGIAIDVLSKRNSVSSIWQDSRFLREAVNVLYDWYAPIQWSPVLGVSKEVGWFFISNRLNKADKTNTVIP
jgi:hypothetical protein